MQSVDSLHLETCFASISGCLLCIFLTGNTPGSDLRVCNLFIIVDEVILEALVFEKKKSYANLQPRSYAFFFLVSIYCTSLILYSCIVLYSIYTTICNAIHPHFIRNPSSFQFTWRHGHIFCDFRLSS